MTGTLTRAGACRRLAQAAMAAVLYGLAACSNTPPTLGAAATGKMAKLELTKAPGPQPTASFKDGAGKPHTLAEFKGKAVIVNIWANWCAPCKAEIPSLAKLAAAFADKGLVVVPVSLGKGADETAGAAFIARTPPLGFYTDPTSDFAFAFRPPAEAMPTTILYDRAGVERARLTGGADWSGPDAKKVAEALLAAK
jgi:thiol-disulfide isomerase/thioredoxin